MKLIYALLITCCLNACASLPTEKLSVPSSAIQETNQYAMLWVKPCAGTVFGGCGEDNGKTTHAQLVVHGSPGRLDVKQAYQNETDLSNALAKMDAGGIIKKAFLIDFRNSLLSQGLNVKAVAKPVYAGRLKQSKQRVVHTLPKEPSVTLASTQFPQMVSRHSYELTQLFDRLNVDYLLMLELLRFGIDRQYGPTDEPISRPLGVAVVRVTLHQRGQVNPVFDDFSQSIKFVANDWNTPPEYERLAFELDQLLDNAVRASMRQFLN